MSEARARRRLSNGDERAWASMILRDLYAHGVRFHRARKDRAP